MDHEWNLGNGDANDYNNTANNNQSILPHLLSQTVSDDHTNQNQYYQSTNDWNDTSYDTDDALETSSTFPPVPLQQRPAHKMHPTTNTSFGAPQNHENRDEDTNYDSDIRRRHPFAIAPFIKPVRIIFIRHGERVDQVFKPDWFTKAFRTNTYKAYDQNLPLNLPKRHFDRAYEFDTPLTGK